MHMSEGYFPEERRVKYKKQSSYQAHTPRALYQEKKKRGREKS